MSIAITGCGTLQKGKLIERTDFFSLYPELNTYQDKIELLGESPHGEGNKFAEEERNNYENSISQLYTKHFLVIQN